MPPQLYQWMKSSLWSSFSIIWVNCVLVHINGSLWNNAYHEQNAVTDDNFNCVLTMRLVFFSSMKSDIINRRLLNYSSYYHHNHYLICITVCFCYVYTVKVHLNWKQLIHICHISKYVLQNKKYFHIRLVIIINCKYFFISISFRVWLTE